MTIATLTQAEQFAVAMELARTRSTVHNSTVHVGVQVLILHNGSAYGLPTVSGYTLSDWFDGATVASWTRGRRD